MRKKFYLYVSYFVRAGHMTRLSKDSSPVIGLPMQVKVSEAWGLTEKQKDSRLQVFQQQTDIIFRDHVERAYDSKSFDA